MARFITIHHKFMVKLSIYTKLFCHLFLYIHFHVSGINGCC